MKDWQDINKRSILNDRTLLKEFANDFQKAFNTKLHIGCGKCIDDAYRRLISIKNTKMKEAPKYKLKLKYEGIYFKGQHLQNGSLTEDIAEMLLKEHPHGEQLFDVMPPKEIKAVVIEEPKKEAPKRKRVKKSK